jgi:glutathione S-transferase
LKKTQGGGLPVVTLKDGTMLSESVPTARLLAKRTGFYPEDPLLAHRCDFTTSAFWDANNKLFDAITGPED